ncbi:hypothetical protein L1049_024783 [Liquidambar formosana]|uniref:RING-type E3 ubiquitin transferase n=1 Tax=Liquidambar formosana TaxID=63359 RepID=A0AAP0RV19_LIQFO
MTRPSRFLTDSGSGSGSGSNSTLAEPPEPVSVESDFVVILAALLCALICVVGLIAVARCAWLRRSSHAGRDSTQASANKGLKKKILQSLPKFTYNSASKGKLAEECAICLAEFAEGDEIRVLPQCGHGFHLGCVDMWLGSHSSCPSCRQILVVARCQKCGQFPAISSSAAAAGAVTEAQLKARQDDADGYLP